MLRRWVTEVRADLVSNIVQPGRFTTIDSELTFHIRERRPNGQLLGIFIDDRRDAKERVTILAEHGEIVEERARQLPHAGERQRAAARDRTARPEHRDVRRYAFDLSQLRERAADRQVFGARALPLGAASRRPPTIRRSTSSRANSAPSCMTA